MGTQDRDFHKKHLVLDESIIENCEAIKELTLQKLVDEGLLDEKAATLFCETFGVVLFKKPWYKRIFKDPDSEGLSAGLYKLKEG